MKRKITLEFMSIVLLSILVFIIGGFFIAKSNINDVTELNLNYYLNMIVLEYNIDNDASRVVQKYEDMEDYLRITFMAPDGEVIVDSLAENLENHLTRPEFNDLGTAYIRHSATLDIEMMYLASALDDGNFVRVSIPTSSLLQFANDFIGLSILIGVLLIVFTAFLSGALINNAIYPLKEVKSILREVNDGKYSEIELIPIKKSEEINDLIREINGINELIAINISSLKSEKDKNDFLLNHMGQGICVLDKDGLIVMLNDFLKRLYRFNIDINLHKDYRFLFRDNEIQESIIKAYEKEINTDLVIKIKEEYYSVSITYQDKNWLNQPSVILIFTDITAIKNIENLKKDFFDNASHELKSPLTAILGSSDLIIQGMAKDEKMIIDLSKRISEEAKRMNNLVMDMLTLSKYENLIQIQHRQNMDINKVLIDVLESLESLSSSKNVTVEKEDREIYINANYDQMFQLLKNLIENAIKYGKESGIVSIKINKENRYLIIKVIDDGIGIPKSDQTRIFERFYRVDKARSKSTGGTGLGLSIVKHIVMNYSGHIELDSTEGKGTTITVYLPERELKLI
ncbi:MAG: GHKL domain-containing protein [Bacilli bacterium]|nr:GHKL domain-containing protein [Bacilli bacterium]